MNAKKNHRSALRTGLLAGGLAAGALGLAMAAGGPSSSSTSALDPDSGLGGGIYDSGMSMPGTGGQPSSEGAYGSGEQTGLPPNITPGWKIRVCSENTKAQRIDFTVSPASGSKSRGAMGTSGSDEQSGMGGSGMAEDTSMTSSPSPQSTAWTKGEATEISLPPELRDTDRIRIEAVPSEKDQKASVCVLYDDHVAKKLNFDDREVSTIKSSDNGQCGC